MIKGERGRLRHLPPPPQRFPPRLNWDWLGVYQHTHKVNRDPSLGPDSICMVHLWSPLVLVSTPGYTYNQSPLFCLHIPGSGCWGIDFRIYLAATNSWTIWAQDVGNIVFAFVHNAHEISSSTTCPPRDGGKKKHKVLQHCFLWISNPWKLDISSPDILKIWCLTTLRVYVC